MEEGRVLFVSGSRVFTDQKVFDEDMQEFVLQIMDGKLPTLVIHGGSRGADMLATNWSRKKLGKEPLVFFPEYKRYGTRNAPLIRNTEMAQRADYFVAFPTKESKGTRHAIAQVKKRLPEHKMKIFEK